MFETVLGLFTSAAGGGLIGLLGTALKQWQERKEREAERAHQIRMREADLQEMRAEADLRLRQTEAEFEGRKAVADIEAQAARDVAAEATRQASYGHDKATYAGSWAGRLLKGFWGALAGFLLVLVDVARGVIRPATTVYLLVIISVMAWQLHVLVQTFGAVTPEQAWPLYMRVVDAIVFMTMTALTWWFGASPNRGR